ncbi:hypothetical protein C8J55DRAFT_561079 [Lentinula edodes]|uniref:Integrase core domain-containing protein n=1 Tax=Lentinula lateritia TaxID=40482 RepID=A0A9W9AB62_9AGAR|nr:hypothetical protein C8J55DRAFT_561079 [Lentinula edodes]
MTTILNISLSLSGTSIWDQFAFAPLSRSASPPCLVTPLVTPPLPLRDRSQRTIIRLAQETTCTIKDSHISLPGPVTEECTGKPGHLRKHINVNFMREAVDAKRQITLVDLALQIGVTELHASTNNQLSTVLKVFLKAVDSVGHPLRIRGGRGWENRAIAIYIIFTMASTVVHLFGDYQLITLGLSVCHALTTTNQSQHRPTCFLTPLQDIRPPQDRTTGTTHLPKTGPRPLRKLRDLDLGNVEATSHVELRTASPLPPPTLENAPPRAQPPGTYPHGYLPSPELTPSRPIPIYNLFDSTLTF